MRWVLLLIRLTRPQTASSSNRIRQKVLSLSATHNVDYSSTCERRHLLVGATRLKAEVLVADPGAPGAVATGRASALSRCRTQSYVVGLGPDCTLSWMLSRLLWIVSRIRRSPSPNSPGTNTST